jgi:hypothetical protein
MPHRLLHVLCEFYDEAPLGSCAGYLHRMLPEYVAIGTNKACKIDRGKEYTVVRYRWAFGSPWTLLVRATDGVQDDLCVYTHIGNEKKGP